MIRLVLLMAISLATQSSAAEGTTSISVSYPSGIQAGDLLVLCVAGVTSNSASEPSATGFIGSGDYFRSKAATSNFIASCILSKEATGSESGSLTVTTTNYTVAIGALFRLTKDEDDWEGLECAAGDDTVANGSDGYTCDLDTNFDPPDVNSGDFYVTCTGADQSAGAVSVFSNMRLTIPDATFTDINRTESDSTTDIGMRYAVSWHTSTSEDSSPAEPLLTADVANLTGTANTATVLFRAREVAAPGPTPRDWLHYFRQYSGGAA